MAWRAHAETMSLTKRESWRLVYGLRRFRVTKQQERALAEVILDGIAPNVERDFLNAHVRIIADSFRSNNGLECSAFPEISFPNIPA
jgi:hypothetical protein